MGWFRRKPGLQELKSWLESMPVEDRRIVKAYLNGTTQVHVPPDQPVMVEALGDGRIAAGLERLLKLFIEHGPELLALIKSIVLLLK